MQIEKDNKRKLKLANFLIDYHTQGPFNLASTHTQSHTQKTIQEQN
jgi:hypothetical protein